MAKAWLRDDVYLPNETELAPKEVLTVDDADPETETEVLPTVTVLVRSRSGYNDDGDPQFEWVELLEDSAVLWEQRTEVDDVTGLTRIVGKVVVLYDGDSVVKESTIVTADTGGTFRVEQVTQTQAGHLEMQLVRIDDEDA